MDPAAKMQAGLPGPGQYAMPAAVGRQPVSTRPSTPSVGFPKAHRDAARKVSLRLSKQKRLTILLQVWLPTDIDSCSLAGSAWTEGLRDAQAEHMLSSSWVLGLALLVELVWLITIALCMDCYYTTGQSSLDPV